jgi:tetratricopeptide (TPR) repeat protein
MLSLEELQAQIANTASDDPTLASLHSRLAAQYKRCIERGESPDPSQDGERAIAAFHQAIALQTQHRLDVDRAKTLNQLAQFYADQSDLKESLRLYQQALTLAQNTLDRETLATAHQGLAGVLTDLGQVQKALDYAQQALGTAQQLENPILFARILGTMGWIGTIQGRYPEAIAHYEQRLQLVRQRVAMDEEESEQSCILEAYTLYALSSIYKLLGQQQQSLDLSRAAIEVAQPTGNLKLIALVQSYRGYQRITEIEYQTLPPEIRLDDPSARSLPDTDLFSPGDLATLEQSLVEQRQALTDGERLGDRRVVMTVLIHLGLTYLTLRQFDQAQQVYQQALALTRDVEVPALETSALLALGRFYIACREPAQAIVHLQPALKLARQTGDRWQEASALMSLGEVYNPSQQPQRAIDFFQEALAIAQQIQAPLLQLSLLTSLGRSYLALQQYSPATQAYEQALQLARQNDRHQDEALILSGLSASAYNANQLEEAIAYGQQAVDLARQFQNSLDEYGALYVLTCACDKNGQAERAIAHCQQAIEAAQRAKTPSLEAHASVRLGCLYEDSGNIAAAIQSFLSAQQLYREVNMNPDVLALNQRIKTLEKQL